MYILRPATYPLDECYICGKPAAVWVYPEMGTPKSSIFPHRFITGRCAACHAEWITNWAHVASSLRFLNTFEDAQAMDLILEVMAA